MIADDHHFLREDRAIRWRRIAFHVQNYPADLAIPLANIERWLALGRVHPAPLLDWRQRILQAQSSPAAMDDLIAFLAAPNHDEEPIKSCSPFVGISFDESAVILS
jgi:hypothetical protein